MIRRCDCIPFYFTSIGKATPEQTCYHICSSTWYLREIKLPYLKKTSRSLAKVNDSDLLHYNLFPVIDQLQNKNFH